MKRWISFILHLAIFVILTSFGSYTLTERETVEVPESLRVTSEIENVIRTEQEIHTESELSTPPFLGKSYNGFKEALGFKESQGRYGVVNTLGYLGKYQFGANTLKLMGVYNTGDFLKDAELQERTFHTNMSRNKWILRRDIKRFNGKRIRGVVVTESGILAAAHLAGAGNVKKYLRSYGKRDVADAYGSTISYYLSKFGGYDVSTVAQKKNPKV